MPDLETSRRRAREERLQAHRIEDNKYVVYNVEKGTQYEVLRGSNGTWYCTCPFATKSSRLTPGNCKHLTRVLDKERGCIKCGATDRRLYDRECTACRMVDRLYDAKL